jgi:GNAT superfamily N-acetyltransferase
VLCPYPREASCIVGMTTATSPQPEFDSSNPRDAELVRLRDGSSVTVRPATAQDEPALRSFLSGLSLEARHLRFVTGAADIAYAAHLAAATGADRYGLIARDEAGALVAHATYVQLDEKRAEVAVEVADHLHGRGLGTILIERLAAVAERRGIKHFIAEVLPENRAMLDVFRDGFDAHLALQDGTDAVEFPTASRRLARKRFAEDAARGSCTGPAQSVSRRTD